MSDNARPGVHALTDDTLRRSGVRDISGVDSDGKRPPPPNPRRDITDPQVGGRTGVTTDWKLHADAPPERIDNIKNTRVFGLIGKNVFGVHSRHGVSSGVGHIPMYHPVMRPAGNPSIAHSDATYIPSVRIGDPA